MLRQKFLTLTTVLSIAALLSTGGPVLAAGNAASAGGQSVQVRVENKLTPEEKAQKAKWQNAREQIKPKAGQIKANHQQIVQLRNQIKQEIQNLRQQIKALRQSGQIDQQKLEQIKQQVQIIHQEMQQVWSTYGQIKNQRPDLKQARQARDLDKFLAELDQIAGIQQNRIDLLQKVLADIKALQDTLK
ncbi:MAG: hypothetical protein ACUVTU_11345 [Desulfurispora sp.]|uniref:hypothetical protein n=1 Tax=Desulfurispora sp. TaxID=3014275 RepID=UPI004049D593